MEIIKTNIEGVLEIIPKIFADDRGYFFESYNHQTFSKAGIDIEFVQDNQSLSSAGVLRGLHFQKPPYEQAKLVRVIKGKVLDVAVDIRKESPTFGQHVKVILDEKKQNMLYIPSGFAHGFLALEESIFCYKCSNFYNKNSESGLLWNDPELRIDWGIESPLVSEKDKILKTLSALLQIEEI